MDINTLLPWSAPKQINTKKGPRQRGRILKI